MENNRVVITGIGVIAPNALGVNDFHMALKSGKSGLRKFKYAEELNFRCTVAAFPEVTLEYKEKLLPEYYVKKVENNGTLNACLAGMEAWKDAGLEINSETRNPNAGIVFGTGALAMDDTVENIVTSILSGQNKRLGSRVVPEGMSSGASAHLNKLLGLGNRIISNSSACITGSEAVVLGYEHIKLGKAEQMLCGSTEGIGKIIWGGFDAMRVLCSDSNENPEYGSRPMSATSSGFIPAGGSGAFVLESLESAKKRNAKIYAEILGGEVNSGGLRNGGTMTAPNSDAIIECIQRAMNYAEIESKDIDLINGHLTSTKGDPLEILNWTRALGLEGDDFPLINTPKSMIGHCIAGAGSVELVASIIQLKHGFVHKNLNVETVHPEIEKLIPKDKIPSETIEKELKTLIKANFGFGDLNCAIVLKNWN